MHPQYPLTLGAVPVGDGRCAFSVWAPKANSVDLHLTAPDERILPMARDERGYYRLTADGVEPGSRYLFRLNDDRSLPDPASRFQPQGVHKPSEVVDSQFGWTDGGWAGLPLKDYVTYELHVGTFTREGTFEAIIPYLDELKDLGITAVELMPVAQFPGDRNWGYDGVHPFAVQNSYGGPQGLRRLVDACHQRGLAVVLDVVYNHLGPEGNYLGEFGHYFSDRHRTPWGQAMNVDGPHSDEVREYFIQNALHWISEFHIDALRLDAVHAIFDQSARPFLRQLGEAVRQLGDYCNRRVYTIAESNLNDPRMVRPRELGGYGLDAQWVDDLHHSLHTVLTGERSGYYEDFDGVDDLVKSYRDGFVYTGQYSRYRVRRHGDSSRELPAASFVVCAQNHDQVGNRLLGERLSELVSYEKLKLAAGLSILSPYLPLLFMGEEYGETAPFQYFVSHTDPELVEAVRKGRREEFASFGWQEEAPDPQGEATFQRCKLDHAKRRDGGRHEALWNYYRRLLELRKTVPALAFLSKEHMQVSQLPKQSAFAVHRWTNYDSVLTLFHAGDASVNVAVLASAGHWKKLLSSSDVKWHGPGDSTPDRIESSGEIALTLAPESLIVLAKEQR
jgi:maltooligosyltrehalose trehalohydrolase